MKATTDNLLTTAAKMHNDRLVRAVSEFPKYRLLGDSDLLNTETGEIYSRVGNSGCNCPDYFNRVAKMRDAMIAEGVATALTCKHVGIRKILAGGEIRIGNLVFRAKTK